MLVLSRKKNQSIVIGDNIQIEVLKISGNTVRIGIAAPREVTVLRGELAPFGINEEDNAAKTKSLPSQSVAVHEHESGYEIELLLPLANLASTGDADALSIG